MGKRGDRHMSQAASYIDGTTGGNHDVQDDAASCLCRVSARIGKLRTDDSVGKWVLLLTTAYAAAENEQRRKCKSCSAEANQKALKGADRVSET